MVKGVVCPIVNAKTIGPEIFFLILSAGRRAADHGEFAYFLSDRTSKVVVLQN
jgi:hypothetical protein